MAVHAFNVKLFRICQLNMFNFKLNGNYSEMFKYISVKKKSNKFAGFSNVSKYLFLFNLLSFGLLPPYEPKYSLY